MSNHVITLEANKIKFTLKEFYDFSWLGEIGKVFVVFDRQDSGNICFGLEKDGFKKFVKFAGARILNFSEEPKVAVERLIQAVPPYYHLKHQTHLSPSSTISQWNRATRSSMTGLTVN